MNSISIFALFCCLHVYVEATIGLKGFLKGKDKGSSGSGRGLFGSLKGGSGNGGDSGSDDGRGLFGKLKGNAGGGGFLANLKAGRGKDKGLLRGLGALGGGVISGDDGDQFPDFPGLNNPGENENNQQNQGHNNKGKGRGKGKLNIFSRLNEDLPCAASLSMIPPLDKIPGVPQSRFPSFLPTGVNTCDATCGGKDSNTCTYNWRDSLRGIPFLLFRCVCKNTCPPKKIVFGGYLNIDCDNVSNEKSRCKCPYGQDSYKCTINILPVFKQKNAYYCTCCNNENGGGYVLGEGGYGGGGYEGGIVSQQQSFDLASTNDGVNGGYSDDQPNNGNDFENSGTGTVGGYADYTDAKSNSNTGIGTNVGSSGAASEVNGQKFVGGFLPVSGSSIIAASSGSEVSNIKPLGSEFLYDHLKRSSYRA